VVVHPPLANRDSGVPATIAAVERLTSSRGGDASPQCC